MTSIKISTITLAILLIAACHTSKKSTNTKSTSTVATTTTATNTSTTQATASGPFLPAKSNDGIYEPSNDELVAIQKQYINVTLDKLKEGYSIYTGALCTRCHGTKNIYKRDQEQWGSIIDDMAGRARLTPDQKDAVLKYVFAIKATQPK